MKLYEANKAIVDRFVAQWTTLRPTVPIFLDNEIVPEPDSGAIGWVRVVTTEVTSRQHTLGTAPARIFRRGGLVLVQVFAPTGVGGARVPMEMAEDVRTIFEGATFGGVSTYAVNVRNIGPDGPSGGRWHLTLVEVLYDFDDEK